MILVLRPEGCYGQHAKPHALPFQNRPLFHVLEIRWQLLSHRPWVGCCPDFLPSCLHNFKLNGEAAHTLHSIEPDQFLKFEYQNGWIVRNLNNS